MAQRSNEPLRQESNLSVKKTHANLGPFKSIPQIQEEAKKRKPDQFELYINKSVSDFEGLPHRQLMIYYLASESAERILKDKQLAFKMIQKAIETSEIARIKLFKERIMILNRQASLLAASQNGIAPETREEIIKAYSRVINSFNDQYGTFRLNHPEVNKIYKNIYPTYLSASDKIIAFTDNQQDLKHLYFSSGPFSRLCKNNPAIALQVNVYSLTTNRCRIAKELLKKCMINESYLHFKMNQEDKTNIQKTIKLLEKGITAISDTSRAAFIDQDELKKQLEKQFDKNTNKPQVN